MNVWDSSVFSHSVYRHLEIWELNSKSSSVRDNPCCCQVDAQPTTEIFLFYCDSDGACVFTFSLLAALILVEQWSSITSGSSLWSWLPGVPISFHQRANVGRLCCDWGSWLFVRIRGRFRHLKISVENVREKDTFVQQFLHFSLPKQLKCVNVLL